jgi:hypothetical protein
MSTKTDRSKSTVATKQIADKPSSKSENNDILEGGEYLGLQVHRELARLGCFTGNIKMRWGRTSRAAVKRFNRVSRFSWPDWPSRDLVKSLRNYPDAYCKKCRGGGEGCEIANTNAPTDEATKPASRSKPEAVTSVPPNLPFGAAKSAAKEASERERAAKEQAAREKAAREQAAREQAAREKAAARERAAREKAAREAAARERAAREQAAREKAAREAAAREQAAKEAARKAAEAKKAAEKAAAAQKAAEEEAAAKEAAAKEAAAKAAAARKAADNAAPQAEPDEGDKQKQSMASVDPVDTGENTEEADVTNDADIENGAEDATDAPSYLPPREMHRTPRVDEPSQRPTKRRAGPRRRKKETSTRVKRQRRSDARRRRKREYQEDTASQQRRRSRQRVWQGDWKPRQSGVGR